MRYLLKFNQEGNDPLLLTNISYVDAKQPCGAREIDALLVNRDNAKMFRSQEHALDVARMTGAEVVGVDFPE